MTSDSVFAERLARRAHAGQTEKFNGTPYAQHLERVVRLVDTDEQATVAWLHDIVEDTPVTIEVLKVLGFDEPTLQAVQLLTRPHDIADETYAQHIERIRDSGSSLAIAVKLADLHDHLRMDCKPIPDGMRKRYEKALAVLRGGKD